MIGGRVGLSLGGECLAVLELPTEPDKFAVVVDDDYPRTAPVEPNEAHRFGWVMELDPSNPETGPCKRTALGRSDSQVTDVRTLGDGRIEVLMTGRRQYRFVSHQQSGHHHDLLDVGRLEVAQDSGEWHVLTDGQTSHVPGRSVDEVLVFCDESADSI